TISPDRLVTFSYAHVPWIKKAQRILEIRDLPKAEQKLSMFEAGFKLLTENGYTAIGLDHFAKANDELTVALNDKTLHRNFQGYCTRETTGQVYAFGTTGISQLESEYAQNTKDRNTYIEYINKGIFNIEKGYLLSRSEKIVRYVINEIMCNHYVSWHKTAQLFNTSYTEIKNTIKFNETVLSEFLTDELITFNSKEIMVTNLGKYFVRNIASSIDPNLKLSSKNFSKAL
ncbi:MAG: coproporphyrinogen III oxidase, partial [Draconibacterium sp.]|nr:coproporphyrinogen III oxidase [Draconibacterium sp.]